MAIHFRPRSSATAPVVFEPANGSNTRSPVSVKNSMKNFGSSAGKRAGCILRLRPFDCLMYALLLSLFPQRNMSVYSLCSTSITLPGIAPPLSSANEPLMIWPEGRLVLATPFLMRRLMSLLYSPNTRRLYAFGNIDGDNQKMYSVESFTRMRRTFTHSAGAGIFAGLNQKNSCARLKPVSSHSANRRR